MDELIRIEYGGEQPTVSGRELHEALGIGTKYADWFPRMCEYGFEEGVDFNSLIFEKVRREGNREVSRQIMDHALTINMAKELCMLQRTEIGRKFRLYFIGVEEAWNSPEAVMARALQFANRKLEEIRGENRKLKEESAIKTQQIAELTPKASYYDVVLSCTDLVPITLIAKDYGWSAKKMNKFLADKGVQFKQGKTWILYQKYAEKGYTQSKTYLYKNKEGEDGVAMHTLWTQKGRLFIYSLLKENGVLPVMEREE